MTKPQNDPRWYDALTVGERIAVLRLSGVDLSEEDIRRGERRFRKWKIQAPFSNDSFFERYLEIAGVDERAFRLVLGCPPSIFLHHAPSELNWLAMLSAVLDEEPVDGGRAVSDFGLSDNVFEAVRPFLQYGHQQLITSLAAIRIGVNEPPYADDVLAGLLTRDLAALLLQTARRTLTLELNVARLRGELHATTPEERYKEYFGRFRSREASWEFFAEYPVLARHLCLRLKNWLRFSKEFSQNLVEDWPEVRAELLMGQDPGAIIALEGMAGDLHRDGRSVIIVKFESGVRVVYKPRSLDIDFQFNELLRWCNAHEWHPEFRLLKVIRRRNHGWSEFIESCSCDSASQVNAFYRRLGGLLCLVYLLEATDVHCENLIASSSHPVLIDLEALFHPRRSQFVDEGAVRFFQGTYENTVLRTAILPQRLWYGAHTPGLDLSGMWAQEGQSIPFQVQNLKDRGTDRMCFVRGSGRFSGAANQPSLAGGRVRLHEYTDAVIQGFADIYRLVARHRDELCAPGGRLDAFAENEIRVILRSTSVYANLLDASFHPDALRSGVERDRLLNRLWVGFEQIPVFWQVVPRERIDLDKGDIPIFVTKPGSRHVWTSAGTLLPDLLDCTGLQLAKARIQEMNETDLARQASVIRGSMASVECADILEPTRSPISEPRVSTPVSEQQLVETALKIASTIEKTAYADGEFVTWMSLSFLKPGTWTVLPAFSDLYHGLAGIAFFFAYLAEVTQRERYRELTERILHTALAHSRAARGKVGERGLGIGAFTGDAGLIYLLCHISRLWSDPDLLSRSEQIAAQCEHDIAASEEVDWLAGVAGYACVLECLFRCTGSRPVLDQIHRCGRRLMETARPVGDGVSWPASSANGTYLTGMAHGAAGVAFTLLRLAALTGVQEYADVAAAGIRFEQGQLGNADDNSLPLRASQGLIPGRSSWCRGAAGIGWALLKCLPLHPGVAISCEIDAAIEMTQRRGFGQTHCLCHGDIGNAEFLFESGTDLRRPELITQAKLRIANCLTEPWRCGNPKRVESPSLMTGLSGIGYGLLRAAFPGQLPSVLMLECVPASRDRIPVNAS
jgi:type 2 lantibiotic biosynthesis protein LanM